MIYLLIVLCCILLVRWLLRRRRDPRRMDKKALETWARVVAIDVRPGESYKELRKRVMEKLR